MISTENLKEIEKKFDLFKTNFDKRYFYFLIFYFTPILILLIVLSKFFKEIYLLFWVRFTIFIFVLIGVILHFLLKYIYFKSNKKYISFIENEIIKFKNFHKDENEFKNSLLIVIKEYFSKEDITYDEEIKKSIFWYNLHRILKIRGWSD